MKTVLFVNFSKQPFSGVPYMWPDPRTKEEVLTTDDHCKWDSVPDSFAPGASRYMEDWRAEHYAKHLINRELDRANKPISDIKLREDMLKLCVMDQSAAEVPASTVDMELMNKNATPAVTLEKSKKKVIKKETKEPEFPDLKQ